MSTYSIGLDLGQSSDYTALAVVQDVRYPTGEKSLHVRHLERYPLRTPYDEIVEALAGFMASRVFTDDEYDPVRHRFARPKVKLLVDKTGVGRPVTDYLKKRGLRFSSVNIHGGQNVTRGDGGAYNVPKRDLVAALELPFHTGEVRVAQGLALWPTLKEELLNFRRKINLRTAHDSYEHWREGDHDDLVLACALATWGLRKQSGALRVVR